MASSSIAVLIRVELVTLRRVADGVRFLRLADIGHLLAEITDGRSCGIK
jgi:hypothetical protein